MCLHSTCLHMHTEYGNGVMTHIQINAIQMNTLNLYVFSQRRPIW